MRTSTVKELQTLLTQSGYKVDIDGIFGKQTRTAINRLHVPDWVKTALEEVGTMEIHGKKHNDRVLEYHSVSGGFSEDEVPWCASFVNWVMLQNNKGTVKYPARAKSWLNYGKSSIVPIVGAIAVKSRSGGGHVCFVVGQDSIGKLYCLGGNQNDEVNIKLYDKNVFIDFRVPDDYPLESLPKYALDSKSNIKEV